MEDAENSAESGAARGEPEGELSSSHAQAEPKRPSTALERYLWSKRISVRQLAEDAKLSIRTVRDACRGRMSARTRTMIYAALDGNPDELLPDYLQEDFDPGGH